MKKVTFLSNPLYLPQIHFAPPPFMTVSQYLDKVNQRYKTEISTEHSYRGDLQTLLETEVIVTNEPGIRINNGK